MNVVYKPWGKEEWLALNEKYCYKRIYINAGFKTSYHYHEIKLETNYIAQGKAEIWLENDNGIVEKFIMNEGDSFTVTPPKKHRVIAISDVILQEVSTPEVDDVIRIEDDTNRESGRLDNEHIKPGVLILAAGMGERLMPLTQYINKALLPINNEAIISKLVKKFPKDYKFVITLGYKGSDVENYLKLAFPNHDFEFVYVKNYSDKNSGPGTSALVAKEFLNRPFYLFTVDCLLTSEIPSLNENWLGVHPTSYPEKYATVSVDESNNIIEVLNKSNKGHSQAFIGAASIVDYETFWNELEKNIENGEIINAFDDISKYSNFTTRKLDWFDTGNLDDLEKAKLFLEDKPLSLLKTNFEMVFNEDLKFIKFIPDSKRLNNLLSRSDALRSFIPKNTSTVGSFLYYDWMSGQTLYELNNTEVYKSFIDFYFENIELTDSNLADLEDFYVKKTYSGISQFNDINGKEFYNLEFCINGFNSDSMKSTISNFDFSTFFENKFTKNFHGDLQFDNIILSENLFYFIDWRDSFGSSITYGDIYYDLAKLYGGMKVPYNLMKNEDNIDIEIYSNKVNYKYDIPIELIEAKKYFEKKIIDSQFSLDIVKKITGLIYINMSPIHESKFSKFLWFKGLKILNENK